MKSQNVPSNIIVAKWKNARVAVYQKLFHKYYVIDVAVADWVSFKQESHPCILINVSDASQFRYCNQNGEEICPEDSEKRESCWWIPSMECRWRFFRHRPRDNAAQRQRNKIHLLKCTQRSNDHPSASKLSDECSHKFGSACNRSTDMIEQ